MHELSEQELADLANKAKLTCGWEITTQTKEN